VSPYNDWIHSTIFEPAQAGTQWPVSAGGNDHFYEAVLATGGITWDSARSAAEAQGGYLATITSAAENQFVLSLLSDPAYWVVSGNYYHGPWLGGFQPPGSPEPSGNWQWVTGEPFAFTQWDLSSFEPNNAGGNEDKLHFHSPNAPGAFWNDIDNSSTSIVHGYIVEYVVTDVPGDANNDGVVDDKDASILGAHWLQIGGANWLDGDFNGDGNVNDADAAILAAHWGEGTGEESAPEPGSLALLAGIAVVGMVCLRRRKA
jgi:hypothetical protein